MFSEALAELRALGQRKATGSSDGFADNFPLLALTSNWKARMERPALSKADWVAFAALSRS
jgi:hypothetical protein